MQTSSSYLDEVLDYCVGSTQLMQLLAKLCNILEKLYIHAQSSQSTMKDSVMLLYNIALHVHAVPYPHFVLIH